MATAILDQAALLKQLDAPPAGVARQVNAFRQRIDRQGAIALQLTEDSDIHVVYLVHTVYISQYFR